MKIFIILTLLFPMALMANITGTWTGPGLWTETETESSSACQVKINFSETIDYISQNQSEVRCDQSQFGLFLFNYKIGGTDLLDENDEAIGSYKNNEIYLTKNFPDGTQVDLSMKIDGNKMNYEETWYDDEGTEINNISAMVTR